MLQFKDGKDWGVWGKKLRGPIALTNTRESNGGGERGGKQGQPKL